MEITRHWRLKAQRYRLQGSICPVCAEPIFPPRPLCPHCGVELAQVTGSVISVLPDSVNTYAAESYFRDERMERMMR